MYSNLRIQNTLAPQKPLICKYKKLAYDRLTCTPPCSEPHKLNHNGNSARSCK